MKNLIIVILSFALATDYKCQWSTDPNVNNAICISPNDQFVPNIISDGEGGAIITWEDFRNGVNYDIYAQRINSSGVVLWSLNGVSIATVTKDQTMPVITPDGSGGAIIVWSDFINSNFADIYAQKINANGTVQWAANGICVCNAVNVQNNPTIISDGSGGAIITWQDTRDGALDIYAQRLDANGIALWNINGIPICNTDNKQENPIIASDGLGGAIIAWQDNRNGTSQINDYDIYVQRINANGDVQWAVNGLAICSLTGNQVYPQIINNKADEVIITWFDFRNSIDSDIYAQRLSNNGSVLWTNDGVAICTATNLQQYPVLVEDGANGAIVTWYDYRTGVFDVYAQRININGDVTWTTDGVPISIEVNAQMSPDIISDGQGGAIIAWRDYRNDIDVNIYAQRVSANGIVQWLENGIAISTAAESQYPPIIASDNQGGAIITWWDYRNNGLTSDIYAQQVSHNGLLGVVTNIEDNSSAPELFQLLQNYPNPFNPSTTISWQSPISSWQTIKLFDVLGREIETIVDGYYEAGSHSTLYIVNSSLPSGVYFYQLNVVDPSTGSGQSFIETKKMILIK